MNKLTRKLILASVSFMFAVIALGTSTFAWFTLTQQASVARINVKIAGAEGLKIGISSPDYTRDDINKYVVSPTDITIAGTFFSGFGESVTIDDIKAAVGDTSDDPGVGNISLEPLAGAKMQNANGTEVDGETPSNEVFKLYKMENYSSEPVLVTVPNKNYMNFKLWFYIETLSEALTLNYQIDPIVTVTGENKPFKLLVDAGTEDGWEAQDPVSVSAANALRITTLQETLSYTAANKAEKLENKISSFAPREALLGLDDLGLDIAGSKALTYYHNIYKLTNAYKNAWGAIKSSEEGIFLPGAVTSLDSYADEYGYMANMFSPSILKQQQSGTGTVQPNPFTVSFANNSGSGNPISTNIMQVEYFIYLDGWDADCFDAILTQTVTIDLSFSVKTTV